METQKKTVVAFDFDGTITYKDSFIEFIKFAKGRRAFVVGFTRYLPLLLLYKLGLYPNWKIKQRVFAYFFGGMPVARFDELGRLFIGRINEIARPRALQAIERYRQQGASIYVVSAGIENYLIPWCATVGIEHVLGTKAETTAQGLLTGNFNTPNCYGREKTKRLLAQEPDRATYTLHAYGDSRGDKELLALADKSWMRTF
jgi:HAD superfamily hydrolase (TIGR01490 family)